MTTPLALLLILAGTVLLLAVSWRSLRRPRSHGFYRFFAFEAILWILVLNAPAWFRRPYAPLQLVSWTLLLVSLALAIHSFHALRRLGSPFQPEPGSPLFRIENTASLVTTGAYRFVRHPLYASLLCLAWGGALKSVTPAVLVLAVLATGFLVATAKSEELENVRRFGEAYRRYMAHTRLFIPFLF